jgi:hypothetical protein
LGKAEQAPQPLILNVHGSLERLLGVAEQPDQQVLGAEFLVAGSRLLGGQPQRPPAHQWGATKWGVGDGVGGA